MSNYKGLIEDIHIVDNNYIRKHEKEINKLSIKCKRRCEMCGEWFLLKNGLRMKCDKCLRRKNDILFHMFEY